MIAGLMPTMRDINAGKTTEIGCSLRAWRVVRRLKQSHIAELLNVSQVQVSRWETGTQTPNPNEQSTITDLLAAGLDSAADRELGRLVRQSSLAVHLICDFTHKLLASSPARDREFRVDASELYGISLWPYASEDIEAAECMLAERGWFEFSPPTIEVSTRAHDSCVMNIPESRFRWTRFRLSDGSFVRLVETPPICGLSV